MIKREIKVLIGLFVVLQTFAIDESYSSDWPQWRGPNRDNISDETGLLQSWPSAGLTRVWLNPDVGLGYSGPAVVGSDLFTMGSRNDSEYLIAVDSNNGQQKWATEIGETLNNGWGDGPRGTPSVYGEKVFAISGKGNIVCADSKTGRIIWEKSMQEFGGNVPSWGYTESPFVESDKLICTPGGRQGTIVALSTSDGSLLWQSKDYTKPAQYSSIIAADHNGLRQYIQLTKDDLLAVDSQTGKVMWKSKWKGKTAVIPTPIYHDSYVYITSGYGVGCKLVRVGPRNKATDIYTNKVMKNHHGGVVLIDGFLYGYSDGRGWICQNFMTGEEIWSNKRKLGKGSITYADERLYCFEEDSGTIVLIESSPEGWKEHGRFRMEPQSDQRSARGKVWTHPVISNGKLYLRDQEYLFCYNVKAQGN